MLFMPNCFCSQKNKISSIVFLREEEKDTNTRYKYSLTPQQNKSNFTAHRLQVFTVRGKWAHSGQL